jgi:hypothetical protein
MTTSDQLKHFCEVAQEIFHEGTGLAAELKDLLKKGAQGRNDVLAIIQSAEAATGEQEQQELYHKTLVEHGQLFERILDMAAIVGKLPARASEASQPVKDQLKEILALLPGTTSGKLLPEDEAILFAEAKISAQLEPCLERFYAGIVPLSLYPVVKDYIAACEACLGHKVGSLGIGERALKVGKAMGEGVAEVVVPGIGALREAWKQLITKQREKDIEEVVAAANTTERLFALRRLDAALSAKLDFSNQFAQFSADSVVESFRSLQQQLAVVMDAIRRIQARAANP